IAGDHNQNLSFTMSKLNLSHNGIYTLIYYSQDALENTEPHHTAALAVDTIPPATTLSINGSSYMDDQQRTWINETATVILEALDDGLPPAGINETIYTIDDENPRVYTEPFTLPTGPHLLHYYSRDNVGNSETELVRQVIVDALPPTTSISYENPVYYGQTETWVTSHTNITLTASDKQSGAEEIYYRVDDGPWITYTTPVAIPWEGSHVISMYSVDQVGNTEPIVNTTIIVHDTPPQITIDTPQSGWIHLFGRPILPVLSRHAVIIGDLTVSVTTQTTPSIMRNVSFALDGTLQFIDEKPPYTWKYTNSLFFGHDIQILAADQLGHLTKKTIHVFIVNV
ncbi:MAG: OmpL47-type beta-barrel domain-containing protein, partial [Thermoplasmatota archaeon]